MKRIRSAFVAGIVISAGILATPASAVPPTVTPSPGYEARLQESRARLGSTTHTPAPHPPKPRKQRQQ